jgi:hypothetical protein
MIDDLVNYYTTFTDRFYDLSSAMVFSFSNIVRIGFSANSTLTSSVLTSCTSSFYTVVAI